MQWSEPDTCQPYSRLEDGEVLLAIVGQWSEFLAGSNLYYAMIFSSDFDFEPFAGEMGIVRAGDGKSWEPAGPSGGVLIRSAAFRLDVARAWCETTLVRMWKVELRTREKYLEGVRARVRAMQGLRS